MKKKNNLLVDKWMVEVRVKTGITMEPKREDMDRIYR